MYKARVGRTEMNSSFSNKSGKDFPGYGMYWDQDTNEEQEVPYHVVRTLCQKRTFQLLWVPLPSKQDRKAVSDGAAQVAWHSGLGCQPFIELTQNT